MVMGVEGWGGCVGGGSVCAEVVGVEEEEVEEGVVEAGEGEEREGGVEELTGTAVRGLEGGALVFVGVSFCAGIGLLGWEVGTTVLGGSGCTCIYTCTW